MFQFDWKKLFDLNYWFEGVAGATISSTTPIIPFNSTQFWIMIYSFSLLFAIGVFLRVSLAFLGSRHPFQKKFPSWSNTLISLGLVGLFWFFCRQSSFWFLGGRFWLIALVLWFVIFAYFVIQYFIYFYTIEITYFRQTKITSKGK